MKRFWIISLILVFISFWSYGQDSAEDNADKPAEKSAEVKESAAETKPAAEEKAKPAETKAEPVKTEKAVEKQKINNDDEEQPQPRRSSFDENKLLAQIEGNTKNPDPYNRLMRYYAVEGKHKERLKVALKYIQNIEGSAPLYIAVGDENKFLGDNTKALISYQFAIKLQPTDSNVYNRIGLILLKMGNYNQAEASFKAALYFADNDSTQSKSIYYNNLGVTFEAMKDLQSAYKYFQSAMKYNPDYGTAEENFYRIKAALKAEGKLVQ